MLWPRVYHADGDFPIIDFDADGALELHVIRSDRRQTDRRGIEECIEFVVRIVPRARGPIESRYERMGAVENPPEWSHERNVSAPSRPFDLDGDVFLLALAYRHHCSIL